MHKVKVTGTVSTIPGGLATGLLASAVITVAGSALAAWVILSGKIAEKDIGYLSLAILLAASVSGAVVSWKKIRHRRMLVCACSGAVYLLTLICMTALFFGGQYEGFWATALTVLGSCLCVGLCGLKRNTAIYKRRHK